MSESRSDHVITESDILDSSHAWQTVEQIKREDKGETHACSLGLLVQDVHSIGSSPDLTQINSLSPASPPLSVRNRPRTPRRRALDTTLPEFDTVFDWGLATLTPAKSQFEDDEHGTNIVLSKKEKIKTRPETGRDHGQVDGQDWEQGQQRTEERVVPTDEPRFPTSQRQKWIIKNVTHYNHLRILFPLPGEKDRERTLKWTEFSNAIGTPPPNFEITHQKNVAYTSTRQADENLRKISVTLHKPHDKLYIQRNIVWNYSLMIKRRLGLEPEDIVLEAVPECRTTLID